MLCMHSLCKVAVENAKGSDPKAVKSSATTEIPPIELWNPQSSFNLTPVRYNAEKSSKVAEEDFQEEGQHHKSE